MKTLSQEKRMEVMTQLVNKEVITDEVFSQLIGELAQEIMLVYNLKYRETQESRIPGVSRDSKEPDLTVAKVWDQSGLAIDLIDSEKSYMLNSITLIASNIACAISEKMQQAPFEEASSLCKDLGYKKTAKIMDVAAVSCPNGPRGTSLYNNQEDFYDDLYKMLQGESKG